MSRDIYDTFPKSHLVCGETAVGRVTSMLCLEPTSWEGVCKRDPHRSRVCMLSHREWHCLRRISNHSYADLKWKGTHWPRRNKTCGVGGNVRDLSPLLKCKEKSDAKGIKRVVT